jgi:hypothetical protein
MVKQWFNDLISLITMPPSVSQPSVPVATSLSQDLALSEFLSRPFLIDNYEWVEGSSVDRNLDVYTLLLSQSAIKQKLYGYNLFRAGLEITVTMSSNPFLYSGLIATYVPLTTAGGSFSNTFGS